MRTTIDKSGRLVIPKSLRKSIGLIAGEVELAVDGAAIRITPVSSSGIVEVAGRIVIPGEGQVIDDDTVQALRDVDQR